LYNGDSARRTSHRGEHPHIKDALGIRTDANAVGGSVFVFIQIVPQKQRETLGAVARCGQNKTLEAPKNISGEIWSGMTSMAAGPGAVVRRRSPMPGFLAM
jgi:hypothetical protein